MHDVRDLGELVTAEAAQLRDSGYEIADLEIKARAAAGASDTDALTAVFAALAKTQLSPTWPYVEPDDESLLVELAGSLPELPVSSGELADRVKGAWLGRCIGNTMGKPLEGLPAEMVRIYLEAAGAWPQTGYVPLIAPLPDGVTHLHPSAGHASLGTFDAVPRDDDIDWTILGLYMVEQFGAHLTTDEIAETWLDRMPFMQTYTAERAAYRNLVKGLSTAVSATTENPYREWIGALIRADIFGYIYPGRPGKAAIASLTDARLTHVKNGVYGEVWAAALVSAAFSTDSPRVALDIALESIPAKSRLAEALREISAVKDRGAEVHEAYEWIDTALGHYHWVHTINNAALIAVGLLWGRDFASTVALTIAGGRDTDSNGATVGSVFGALHGAASIPQALVADTNLVIRSSVRDFDRVSIPELVDRTLRQIKELA
jgi:ADP-ribosylglycohydrolase